MSDPIVRLFASLDHANAAVARLRITALAPEVASGSAAGVGVGQAPADEQGDATDQQNP